MLNRQITLSKPFLNYQRRLLPRKEIFPLNQLTIRGRQNYGERVVMREWTGSGYRELNFKELDYQTSLLASFLRSYGFSKGDKVGVIGENCPEWGIAYLGVIRAGGVVIPIDCQLTPEGILNIINHSQAQILCGGSRFIKQILELNRELALKFIILYGEPIFGYPTLAQIVSQGSPIEESDVEQIELHDLAAILYTSGTTGISKGVMLTHYNIMSDIASCCQIFPVGVNDNFLSLLPLHHSFECTTGFLLPLFCGSSITYARSLASADILADIRETGVTMMMGVPLLYEKMYNGFQKKIAQLPLISKIVVRLLFLISSIGERWGMDWGKALFKSFRNKAGLSSIRFLVSGGGPLNPEIAHFFNRIGLKLLQGYGLTETSPVTHVNPPWKNRPNTVGPPIPGVRHRIADPDPTGVGEVELQGDNVFIGYYQRPDLTSEAFTPDGWFKTGDLGVIHSDNYLELKGRKKNLIVTGGGKNVYPEEIEFHLMKSPFISEVLVLGAPRHSGFGDEVVALIYPNREEVIRYFAQKGELEPKDRDVHQLIREVLRKCQIDLPEYKKVRRFKIVEEEFVKTSTRKIMRHLYSWQPLWDK